MATKIAVISAIKMLIKSDSDTDFSLDEKFLYEKKKKHLLRPCINEYYETVIFRYTDNDFKSHFRLQRTTFEYISSIISPDLVRKTTGNETIPSGKQFMIALWKMATIDSYRYFNKK
ncbi:hypothetical protein PUN28_009796 [Cardiocondyla obscurior]|uniref:Uncharacterized protein n=1 Tax=Cardiocondyla obscurior TaxID=286306 RepID=A0AAW2FKD8_9HYME